MISFLNEPLRRAVSLELWLYEFFSIVVPVWYFSTGNRGSNSGIREAVLRFSLPLYVKKMKNYPTLRAGTPFEGGSPAAQ